jgi:hypothetical protein
LTVPLTASSPIEPPGKRSGLTTNASVVIASSPTSRGVVEPPCRRPARAALDELRRRLAAGAVGHRDRVVAELRALGPGGLDDPEDRVLASETVTPTTPAPGEASEVVVGGAGALARDHARPDRPLRRARGAEDLALPRLDHALEHLAALARLRVGDADARHAEAQLGVEVRRRPP